MRVIAANLLECSWLGALTKYVPGGDATGIKAVDSAGRIRGMVAFDNWTTNSVRAHMAVESPIVWRSLLGPAFDYPFRQCGRRIIVAHVPEHSIKSMQLVRRMGFIDVGRIKDGFGDGDDLVFLEMRKENCRWIRQERKAA